MSTKDISMQPIAEDKIKSDKTKEVHKYDVEMNNLMSIIINSMYSSKEYFLRELISNCSDACDKVNVLRQELRESGVNLDTNQRIVISFDDNSLIIEDNGIGMKKEELVNFLGCVANSGTKKFREAVKSNQKSVDDLIGQFGLGFYSSFLVADYVNVISKYPGEEKAYMWSSTGLGQYQIEEVDDESLHGTKVILSLKEGCKEFLKKERIQELIKKYSMFITYAIIVKYQHEVEVEEPVEEDEKDEKVEEEKTDEKVEEAADEKVEEKKEVKKVKKIETKEEQINKEKPLWTMNPKEITKEMYSSFYKAISNDWDDYLTVKHSHLEGSISLDILLFAPKRPKFNMFMDKSKKNNNIKLYCNSVYVTDELDLPDWMQCVTGVVSSGDLPINVSREFLQGGKTKKLIKKTITKKTIELLNEMKPETYNDFYKEFSTAIKLAVRDEADSTALEPLLRFNSNKRENISLSDYVSNMKEGQKSIYIITGTTKEEVIKSPFVTMFKDYEVLFLIDTIDEYLLQKLKKYQNYDLVKINQEGIELPNSEVSKEMDEQLSTLKEKIQNALGDQVEKVEFKNLGDKHMLVQTPKHSISPAMEKILAAQVSLDKSNMFMFPKGKKILQVNVSHPITFKLNSLIDSEQEFKNLISLLFKVTCVQCGYNLDDPVGFSDMVISALVNKKDELDNKVSEKVVDEEEVH